VIRVTKVGRAHLTGQVIGWHIEGDGEQMTGDFNDMNSQAGKVLLAAALIHSAGYAGFVLVENEEAQLDAARATLVAIDVARRREPRE